MTMQSKELLIIKDREYIINSYPLESYFSQRTKFKFNQLSTGNRRGYLGNYTIENNKFYLIDFQSENYTLKSIFNTEEKVFLDWFSDIIFIGIGDFKFTRRYNITFEKYLCLKIVNGIIEERHIVVDYKDNFEFNSQSYYSKDMIGNILDGLRSSFTTNYIKDYIKTIINFFSDKDFNKNIKIPSINFTKQGLRTILKIVSEDDYNYLLTNNFLAIEPYKYKRSIIDLSYIYNLKNIYNIEKDIYNPSEVIITLLENILSGDYSELITMNKYDESFPVDDITDINKIGEIIANIQNEIKENKEAFIPPHILNKRYEHCVLINFSIKKLNNYIIEYSPNIDYINDIFDKEIIEINTIRFQENNNYYEYIPSVNSYKKKYPSAFEKAESEYYLSIEDQDQEFYFKEINVQAPIIFERKRDYINRETYDDYSDSYAQRYEGLSDRFIDDVFDGDPDLYWNID